ncbi:dockerin type I repeat-containing protein [Ruminococcus sp.]|uniref:dockerin type I repeat-containing protein n=1 Tax=Ruminococcus sp. TaxID=41978 RepID=UPI0025DCCEBE|nr:dockerin type I repeat-containing protein [Ruminococcus sp.]MBQ8966909.1 dockerin type I repeat-containing protein [Ruminococcus sp.]
MNLMKKISAISAAAVMLAAPAAQMMPAFSFAANAETIAAEEDSTDFLLDCSSRWGYDQFSNDAKGKSMRALYNKIWDESVRLWNSTDENLLAGTDLAETGLRISLSELDISQSDAEKVVRIFRNDNPIFYWISGNVYFEDGKYIYTVERAQAKGATRAEEQKNIENYVKKTYDDAWGSYMTYYAFAHSVHEKIINKTDYKGDGSSDYRDYSIYGPVINHTATSEGLARVYQLVLNYADVANAYFLGKWNGHDEAFNMIKLDDEKWYYCDLGASAVYPERNVNNNSKVYFAMGSTKFSSERAVYFDGNDEGDPHRYQAGTPSPATEEYPNTLRRIIYKGDANMDEEVNVTDVNIIAAHVKNIRAVSAYGAYAADANNDGEIDVTDVVLTAAQVKGLKVIPGNDGPRVK